MIVLSENNPHVVCFGSVGSNPPQSFGSLAGVTGLEAAAARPTRDLQDVRPRSPALAGGCAREPLIRFR
jgi:hypothetical protein